MTKHKQLQNDIIRAFGIRGDMRLWPNAPGKVQVKGRWMQFGVKGQADLSGILLGGRRVEIECKVLPDTQKPEQKDFQSVIERMGGLYVLAYSVEDVAIAIKEAVG